MSDHQPLPVHGYTPQSETTVEAVNANKVLEEQVLRRLDALQRAALGHDQRWLSMAREHIEQGFMCLNRAIFKPQRISLDPDATREEPQ